MMDSPIQPVQGEPSAEYTVVTDPIVPVTLKGNAGQVVLQERLVKAAAFGIETVEHYEIAAGQDQIARAFMNDCLAQQTCIDAERKSGRGENSTIEVTWAYDRDDAEWVPGSDERLWDFEIQDTSQPLASHPYFGRHDSLGADLDKLMQEMGRCDQSIALGKDYAVADPEESAIKTIMARYAGLRYAGVDECNPIVVVLSCRYRLYQSQTESDGGNAVTVWPWLFHGINRVIDLSVLEPPAHILSALSSLESWTYDETGNEFPDLVPSGMVWIRQKPLVKLSGRNPKGPSDVTEYLLGVQQASRVLHPPLTDDGSGWDPQKVVE